MVSRHVQNCVYAVVSPTQLPYNAQMILSFVGLPARKLLVMKLLLSRHAAQSNTVFSMILSAVDVDRLPIVSLYLTYTRFVPSQALHHAAV